MATTTRLAAPGDSLVAIDCRLVAIDFDETLFRVPACWPDVLADVARYIARREGIAVDPSALATDLTARRGASLTALVDVALAFAGLPEQRHAALRAEFDVRWRAAADALHTTEHLTPGAIGLAEALRERDIPLYVVTGGDVDHKRSLLATLPQAALFPPHRTIGDGDSRMGKPPRKANALRAIAQAHHLQGAEGRYPAVMIGDGAHDMLAAREAGYLALGFNQEEGADLVIRGGEFPVNRLLAILTKSSDA